MRHIVINKPPGSPDVTDCSNIDIDNLSDEEFRRYKKNCSPTRGNERPDCDEVEVSKLSVEEFKRYTKKCGGIPSSPGDSITIEKEVVVNKSPRDGSVPPVDVNVERKTSDDCESVNVDNLTAEELEKYKKECGTRKGSQPNCDDVDINSLTVDELIRYKKRCGTVPRSPGDSVTIEKEVVINKPPGSPDVTDCSNIDIDNLSDEEFRKYKKNCRPGRRTGRPDCDEVEVSKLSVEEFKRYTKRCGTIPSSPGDSITIEKEVVVNKSPRDGSVPPEDINVDKKKFKNCKTVNIDKLTIKELEVYKKECGTTRKEARPDCADIDATILSERELRKYEEKCGPVIPKPRDCGNIDVDELTKEEYRDYKKQCESVPEVPANSVTIEKEVVVNKGFGDCSAVRIEQLSDEDYEVYKKRCGPTQKTPSSDCEGVDVNSLSDEEYKIYRRKCLPKSLESCSDVNVDKMTEKQYHEYTKRCVDIPMKPEELASVPENPHKLGDCKNVFIKKLDKDEYEIYKNGCPTNKSPECTSVDFSSLSDAEFQAYKDKCAKPRCEDVNVEELSADEFTDYKRRCSSIPPKPKPTDSRKSISDCSQINVEELNSEEYNDYKKRCIPKRTSTGKNCSNVDIDALSDREYDDYRRRCPPVPENVTIIKKVVIECANRKTDKMTKEEYLEFQSNCTPKREKPHIELVKIVKVEDGDVCLNRDVNTMTDDELAEFQKKCGVTRRTFQINCNDDVRKMSDEQFEKFRKVCGRRPPIDCSTSDVDSLTDEEYSRYLKQCGPRRSFNCKTAKVERMSAEEFAKFKKECPKKITKNSDDCNDVKVEELSMKQFAEFKKRCLPTRQPSEFIETPPAKERKKIDCSIIDTRKMSNDEYADFKKYCSVKVRTDEYRPGENIILTKQVNIRPGKDKFSCYDRDVDKMSEEEYAEFERRCRSLPVRYDCSIADTTQLSREQYIEYQKQCPPQNSVVVVKKLVINKPNVQPKDGCYNRDVETMSDAEYKEYQLRCLGIEEHEKPERKTAIDCHNVDLSKLSNSEIEEHIRACRTRETTSTPAPSRRRSLKCSDVKTADLNDADYDKWVKECLETSPKTITLKKKLVINGGTPLLTGGENVKVEKFEIRRRNSPDDDEGYLEGSEDFGVRITSKTLKRVQNRSNDSDEEAENGIILVKKVIHQMPRRRRPNDLSGEYDEGGVVEVKKLVMRTGRKEPDGEDSEDVEEIVRRPRKNLGPKEEVVLISVSKKHGHPYKPTSPTVDEEPVEVVKLTKNTRVPNKILREVRIKKNFGQGIPSEETTVQEITGDDFRIIRKTVMVPRRVRKLKSTTTTTTTPSAPEYYYDEEEVPEIITIVKSGPSKRPLRKTARPMDEDEEYVDIREDSPESFFVFEGFVKVRAAPKKIAKRPRFTDSGEEPEIREVTRKVFGKEFDDFKGVKLRSHRKILRRKTMRPEDIKDDGREVTVVKKLKVLKFGDQEKETFDDENVEDDGRVVVRNQKRKYWKPQRPQDVAEDEEQVRRKVAVRGRAPKRFQLDATVNEETSQYYKIGGSQKDDSPKRRPRLEKAQDEDEFETLKRKKIYRIGPDGRRELVRTEGDGPVDGEEVKILKKKVYRIGPDGQQVEVTPKSGFVEKEIIGGNSKRPRNDDSQEEIVKKKRRNFYRVGVDGKRELIRTEDVPEDAEAEEFTVKGQRKKGPIYRDQSEDEDFTSKRRMQYKLHKEDQQDSEGVEVSKKNPLSEPNKDQSGEEELKVIKRKKFYRIGPDGKRELVRTEGDTDGQTESGEQISMKKKRRFYRIGKDGQRELIREEEDGSGSNLPTRKPSDSGRIQSDEPVTDQQKTLIDKFYRRPGGNREENGQSEGSEEIAMKKKKRFYRIGKDGERELIREEDGNDSNRLGGKKSIVRKIGGDDRQSGEDIDRIMMKKKRRFYRIGKDGKRELIREEDGDGSNNLGRDKNTYSPVPLNDQESAFVQNFGIVENVQPAEDQERISIKKNKRFYRVGKDGKRELVREESGKDSNLLGKKKSTYSPEPFNHQSNDNNDDQIEDGEKIMMKKKRKFYRIGKDGKRELIREEEAKNSNLLGRDKHTYSPKPLNDEEATVSEKIEKSQSGQSTEENQDMFVKKRKFHKLEETEDNDDQMEDGEKIMMKKKRRFYRIGKDGKRELIREEDGDDSNLLGRKKSTYSPEPLNDQQSLFVKTSGQSRQSNEDNQEMVVKKRKSYELGNSGGNDDQMEDSEKIMMKKKRRFYRIGKDGKRELIREETGDDSNLLGRKKSTFSPEPLNDGVEGNDTDETTRIKVTEKTEFDADGKAKTQKSVEKEVRDNSDEDQKHRVKRDGGVLESDKVSHKKAKSLTHEGFERGGAIDPVAGEGDGRSSRTKRTRGGDGDMHLGRLLKSKHEREREHKRRHPRRFSKPGKYHKDGHVRSSGKSEEDIPDAQ